MDPSDIQCDELPPVYCPQCLEELETCACRHEKATQESLEQDEAGYLNDVPF